MAPPLTAGDIAILQHALARVQAGDGAGGAALIGQLPLAARGHPDALTVAAMAERAAGRPTAARPLFEAALRAAPGHPGIWNSYANLLDDLGEAEAAMAAYHRALAITPQAASIWTNLAIAAIAAARWDEADAALDRALALAPGDARALSARGSVAQARGALPAAAAAYRQVLAAAPGDARTRHNLATVLRTMGDPEQALAVLGNPTLADSLALRGHLLADLGRFDAAVADYRAVLAREPGHAVTLEALAELLPQLGRADEALAGYRAALTGAAPPALWQAAIAAAKGLGDAAAQRDWARAAAARHGRKPDWLLAEAGALSQLGESTAALAIAETAARDFPDSAATHNYVAWLRLKAGDAAGAEPHALCATRLAPHDQSPWALLTLIWRMTGDAREAWLADYDRLVITAEIMPPRGWSSLSGFLDDLKATLTRRHLTVQAPADQSLRGGTQTRGRLFDTGDPVLQALRDALVATVESGLAGLPHDPNHPFLSRCTGHVAMAGSWSVRLRGQGFHISHIHPSGWLSSAFYVDLPPEIGSDGDAGKLMFGVPDAALGLDLAPRRLVTPQAGRLAIFPSYFWHGTVPFDSASARLTVAFDALPI